MNGLSPPPRPRVAQLTSRTVIGVTGPEWRGFLQGLVTQDVETLRPGEMRFGALLTPQGRLLFDLFLDGADGGEGCLIDVAAAHRDALVKRLTLYRLRAKVTIAPLEARVWALWNCESPGPGWAADPRLPGLGFRGYGAAPPLDAEAADEPAYDRHRFDLGVPGPADWGHDRSYPIEANFDLLGGIDFKKGCFVGQETTSRMKRRGTVKSRMAPIAFEGPAPAAGSPLLAGGLRAGEVLSGADGGAMALLRLDRLGEGPLTLEDGRAWRVPWPDWLAGGIRPPAPEPSSAPGT
jgi:folate-binding protein YgfZ